VPFQPVTSEENLTPSLSDSDPKKADSCKPGAVWHQAQEEGQERQARTAGCRGKVLGLLNKLSERNEASVVAQLGDLQVTGFEDFSALAEILFEQALRDPFFCTLYIRVALLLSKQLPRFSEAEARDKSRPSSKASPAMTLMGRLLQLCQAEFEWLCTELQDKASCDTKESESVLRKDRGFACVGLMAELFKAEVLSARAMAQALVVLLRSKPLQREHSQVILPPGSCVELSCELLQSASEHIGFEGLKHIMQRLAFLKDAPADEGDGHSMHVPSSFAYPARLRFLILNVLEAASKTSCLKLQGQFKCAAEPELLNRFQ